MAGKKKQAKNLTGGTQSALGNVTDYRHDEATRKNNPPAKIAAEGGLSGSSTVQRGLGARGAS
jgi:hypothetical protein